MIQRYNRSQTLRAIFSLFIGLVALLVPFIFLRLAAAMGSYAFGLEWSDGLCDFIGLAGVVLVSISGYRTWKAKGGLHSYHESAFFHDLGGDTGGAVMVDYYAHRITAPAHVLNQLFLAGPLRLLDAWTAWNSRLPESVELESRLEQALVTLKAANKWQSLSEHPGQRNEILNLAQMGLIDFSAHKGEPRIKAR